MHLTKKIPLYPNKKTQDALWNISHLCTNLWNCALEQRKDKNSYGKINIYSQKKELTLIKKEFEEYKIPSSQILQNVLFSLDRSYKQFYTKWKNGDKAVRPPKFKSKKYFFSQDYSQYKTSFFIVQEQKILQLAYGKNKKEWLSIPFNEKDLIDCGNFKTCIISYDNMSKKWYASITYVFEEVRYQKNNYSIYFDPGAKTTLTGITSGGEFVEYDINPLRKLNINTYKFIDKLISQRDKLNKKRQYK